VISASVANDAGMKRAFRKRRAHPLQNRRLVQKCQRNRSSFAPHSAQKFGLYIVRTPADKSRQSKQVLQACRNDQGLCVFFARPLWLRLHRKGRKEFAEIREEPSVRHFRKQLKRCLARPKVAGGFVEIVRKAPGFLKISPSMYTLAQLQKVLLAGILSEIRTGSGRDGSSSRSGGTATRRARGLSTKGQSHFPNEAIIFS